MIPSNMKEMLKEIKYIFTKEYQKECEYIEFQQNMKDKVKLKCDADESIDEKIDRLRASNYKNNCRINCSSLNSEELTKLPKETSSSLGFEYEKSDDTNKKMIKQ